jgi:hypothetical protein
MIRKIFKWSFKILTGIILIAALFYGGFHLWEYATGGKYIKYLSENSEGYLWTQISYIVP